MSAQSFRIFISSPGDVGREREVAYHVIERVEAWFGGRVKLEGYFWEHEPMRTTRGDFQGQIPESSSFDLVVCILWSRLGSRLHPGNHQRPDGSAYASGTEYEFESAIEAFQRNGLPDLLVYRRIETPLFPPEPREEMEVRLRQWEALKAFCERWFRDEREKTFTAAFNAYKDSGDFERTFEDHLKRLVEERLTKSGGTPGPTTRQERWWQGSPYRGLQVFEFEHEPIFFGRTKARDEVLGALRARWVEEKCPFVMIFGASGGGKSSLLRAGVLPWLVRPGLIEGVGMWRMALLRPSDHAGDLVDGLARSLTAPKALPELLADGTTVEELARMLREEPKAITGLIKGALSQAAAEEQRMENLEKQPAARLSLGLDQLEEVFTLQEQFGQESRQLFFRGIAALARSGLVWVVATLRSDFYNRCEEVPELVELKRKSGQYHLLPPAEVELSQMIRYPAEAAGLVFQEDPVRGKLEEIIAREAQGQPGALPLLQYALDLLYHAGGADGLLTHEEYERVGRVTGAVAKKAEQTFAELSTQEMNSLDGVLRGMVTLGEGEEEVAARKVARYEELTRTPGAKGLVDAFLEARLFTGDQDAGGYATVTVAHEALLRVWPRVVAWVRANRAFLRQRARLGQALEQWKTRDGHEDYLLARGLPLAEAESLLKQHEDALSEDEAAFIRASQVRAQRDDLRRAKVRRAVMAGLIALTLLALGGGVFAAVQWKLAKEANEKQHAMLQQASEQDYNVAHRLIKEGDPNLALNYLARAITYNPSNQLARLALSQTLLVNSRWPFRIVGKPMRHEKAVNSAVFSPDGKLALTASNDKTARLWEAATGKPVGEPMRHEKAVNSAVFSPDGKLVLTTADKDYTARLWDAATGKPVGESMRHERAVNSAVFSPEGKFILTTADEDNAARLWEAATGKPVGEPMRHEKAVHSAVFSPDGRLVLTASKDKTARLWEAATGKPAGEPMHLEGDVLHAVFSPDGKYVLTVNDDDTARNPDLARNSAARLWDAATGKPVGEPMRREGIVYSAVFSPDGKLVLTVNVDNTAWLWEAATGKPVGEPMRHEKAVDSAIFSPDGKLVLTTAYEDTAARLWEAATGKPVGEPMRHEKAVHSAVFSPDGKLVLTTASNDNAARLWEAATGKPIGEPVRHEAGINRAVFSPDGKLVLTASNDKTARLWEAATGKPVGEPLRHAGDVRYAVFSPDGKLILATAIRDTTFGTYGLDNSESRLWEAATGKPVGEPMPHQVESFRKDDAVFSPDGKFVLTIVNVDNPEMRGDRAARLWDAATGKPVGEPMRDEKAVISAVFSPDGKLVLTRDDYVPRLWETATGKPVGWPMRHEKAVNSVVFSPDGRLVLTTASNDNAARLWEAATGKPVGEPMRHEKAVHLAVFSPDGRLVLTASDDKTAWFWEAATGKPMGEPMPHEKAVNRAVFSPDGKLVLFEDDDYAPQLWEVATGKPVGEPMRHEKAFNRAVFSPDGKLVLTTAHKDTAARLWEAATGKPVGEPMRHEKAVKSAVFSPDGKLVLTTADEDSAARLWDAATGKPAGEPMCHEKAVNCAVFSPDGKLVLTACADYAARLWPVPQPLEQRPEQLVTVSEGITLRRIAPDGGSEWLYPSDSPVEGQLAEPLRWFAEPVRTRAIWSGASLSVPQYIFREIQDARRRFREDEADARQILNEAYIVDPAYPLIHLALAMNEDEQAARFLRDFDLKRLPESCNYTQDLDPREALKLAAQMCSEQGDEERARLTMAKLKALNAR